MKSLILCLLLTAMAAAAPTAMAQQGAPPAPQAAFTRQEENTLITWNTVQNAHHYQVLFADGPDSPCNLGEGGRNHCVTLTSTTTSLSFLHPNPPSPLADARYFVSACSPDNQCSPLSQAVYRDTTPAPLPAYSLSWRMDQGEALTEWQEHQDAAHYRVNWTPYRSVNCNVSQCLLLEQHLEAQAYRHHPAKARGPHLENHYWISACNPGGCSQAVKATFTDLRPAHTPEITAVRANEDGSNLISWLPVPDAVHYRVYHLAARAGTCRLDPHGNPSPCRLLPQDLAATHYVHQEPDPLANRYWLAACNAAGCAGPSGPGRGPEAQPAHSAEPPPVTPATEPNDEPGPAALQLSRTTVYTTGQLHATLTFTNPDPVHTLHAELTVHAPDGWAVSAFQQGATCVTSLCRAARSTPPGHTINATATLTPNSPGRHTVAATARWRTSDGTEHIQHLDAAVNVIAHAPAAQPQPPSQPAPPGAAGSCNPSLQANDASPALLVLVLAAAFALKTLRTTGAQRSVPA